MLAGKHPLAHIIADPSAMGLYGFAVVTFVAGSLHAKWYTEVDSGLFSPALCYGGAVQIIAGLLDLLRGVKVGGSTFVAFGLYWFSQGQWLLPANKVVQDYPDPSELKKLKACYILGFAFVALATTMAELKSNWVKIVLLGMVTFDFTALSIVSFTGNEPFEKVVGYVLVLTAALAWYLGTAHFFEDGNGPFELPIGRIKKQPQPQTPGHKMTPETQYAKTLEDTI